MMRLDTRMFGDRLRTTGFLLLFGLAGVTSASAPEENSSCSLMRQSLHPIASCLPTLPTTTLGGQNLRPRARLATTNGRDPALQHLPKQAAKGWHLEGKSVCCSPKPLRWPLDVHVLFGPGPEHQEKQL
jgi:hypothetical protein